MGIWIEHANGRAIEFDKVIPTEHGDRAVYACGLIRDAELMATSTEDDTRMSI